MLPPPLELPTTLLPSADNTCALSEEMLLAPVSTMSAPEPLSVLTVKAAAATVPGPLVVSVLMAPPAVSVALALVAIWATATAPALT